MDNNEVFINSHNVKLIRVLSCIGVVLTHIGGGLTSNQILLKYFGFGAEGVRCFFILSGFLMCFSVDIIGGNIKNYYKKRALRIFPVYYLVIVGYLFFSLIGILKVPEDNTGIYWLRYFLFISTSIPSDNPFWTNLGGTWTISYFVFFYLLAPLLWKYLNSWEKCVISSFVAMIIGIALPHGYLEPVKGLHAFILGMAIYWALKQGKVTEMIVISLVASLVFIIPGFAYPYGDTFLLTAISVALLSTKNEYRVRLFDKPIDFLNKHSYTIYLIHLMIFTILSETMILGNGKVFAVSVVVLAVILSWIIDIVMELLIRHARQLFKEGK